MKKFFTSNFLTLGGLYFFAYIALFLFVGTTGLVLNSALFPNAFLLMVYNFILPALFIVLATLIFMNKRPDWFIKITKRKNLNKFLVCLGWLPFANWLSDIVAWLLDLFSFAELVNLIENKSFYFLFAGFCISIIVATFSIKKINPIIEFIVFCIFGSLAFSAFLVMLYSSGNILADLD